MSYYGTVLAQNLALVSALPGFLASVPGVTSAPGIVLRDEFEFIPNQDRVPMVIMSPAENFAERVEFLTFEDVAVFSYDVYFAIVTERRFDAELRNWRLDRRQELADKLYDPTILQGVLAGQWDVDYDSNPGQLRGLPETLRATTQKFTYKVERPRRIV